MKGITGPRRVRHSDAERGHMTAALALAPEIALAPERHARMLGAQRQHVAEPLGIGIAGRELAQEKRDLHFKLLGIRSHEQEIARAKKAEQLKPFDIRISGLIARRETLLNARKFDEAHRILAELDDAKSRRAVVAAS